MNIVVSGLGYGDEGKGAVTDALVRIVNSKLVVRYNGGPQAAHHVVCPNGPVHRFAQFGSGTLVPGVSTYLSRFMLVEPIALRNESQALEKIGVLGVINNLFLHRESLLITPYHRIMGRMRELARGDQRQGSCGLGVGETITDYMAARCPSLTLDDLRNTQELRAKLSFIWQIKVDQGEQLVDEYRENPDLRATLNDLRRPERLEQLCDFYSYFIRSMKNHLIEADDWNGIPNKDGSIIFEGAQGVLLDREWGFGPYVTKTRTTLHNAHRLLNNRPNSHETLALGVLRTYATRHGPGPFVSEDQRLLQIFPEVHNSNNPWQGSFRTGWLDLVSSRYAIRASGGIDALAINHLDCLIHLPMVKVCTAYRFEGIWDEAWNEFFEYQITPSDTIINNIRVPDVNSTARQKLVTHVLNYCKPIYREFSPEGMGLQISERFMISRQLIDFLHFLESEDGLGVPIALISLGPTAQDKVVWRKSLFLSCSQV